MKEKVGYILYHVKYYLTKSVEHFIHHLIETQLHYYKSVITATD